MHLELNPDEIDTVDDLRTRLAGDDRLWDAVAARLAAFARLERLAQVQGTTPEVAAVRATVARDEARLAELQQAIAASRDELAAFDAVRAERMAEVAYLTEARDDLQDEVATLLDTRNEHHRAGSARAGAGGAELDPADDELDRAFAAFFDSELEHDKSRDWILSTEDPGA